MTRRVIHIIVAAGSGSRFGGDLPKQFLPLSGERPVLMYTLDCFMSRVGEEVILVLSPQMETIWLQLCDKLKFTSPRIIHGGPTRHGSVANALSSLDNIGPDDIVTVHDGARPIVANKLLDDLLEQLRSGETRAVIPVVDVTDSLRLLSPDGSSMAVNRALYRAVQTPQAFIASDLIRAYSTPETPEMTDEASVIEIAGIGKVDTIPGDPHNIKITRPGDIEIARLYLNSTER